MVRGEWNAEATISAWQRWHTKSAVHLGPMTEALLQFSELPKNAEVLDLASGSGEPALSIAAHIGPAGHVTATDLSAPMLALAESQSGSRENMSFQVADAHELPFEDETFTAVTSRLGVMYFWDIPRAMAEVRRVLKPGGNATFVAWQGPQGNALARTALAPFVRRSPPPNPPPGAPGPFRFAKRGSLSAVLERAGFADVEESHETVACPWPGPPEELWQQLYEVAVPLQPYFDAFDSAQREEAIAEVIAEFHLCFNGKSTDPTAGIVLARGTKPV